MYPGWGAIDALERAAGEAQGRPRVKLCTWEELLAAARGRRVSSFAERVVGSLTTYQTTYR